jgi:hypothetical protein
VTADEHQRLLLGVLMAAHDLDERAFRALLSGLPRRALLTLVRQLAEVVVGGQIVTEERPGAARDRIAYEALTLAGR